MASIRQRGGRWQARVTRHGYLTETKTFDSYEAAVKWARSIESEIDKGAFVSLKEAERTTLKDVLLRYADEVSPGKRSGGKDNIAKLKFLARQRFANLSLANLTPKAIALFRDERLATVSPGTVLLDLATIRSVLNHARREWGIAIENPVEKIRKPPSPPHRDRVLNQDEENRLLNILTPGKLRGPLGRFSNETRDIWLKPMVILAIESAMRRGELLALEWKHVDIARRTVYFPWQSCPYPVSLAIYVALRWHAQLDRLRAKRRCSMTGKLTLITTTQPASLGKTFRLTATGLERRTAGQMLEGSFEVRSFTDVAALAEVLAGVGNNQAIMASMPADGRQSGCLVTKAEKSNHPGALARTKEDFCFPANQPGLMVLDYDPPPGTPPPIPRPALGGVA